MEIGNIIPHIEALIFASDKPLTSMEITELINNAFGFMEEKLTLEQIQTSLDGIIEKYASEFYPFEVRESGGGWQFLTKRDFHKTVAQLNGEKFLKRLSSAALETLAIIAYKQPITKGEIESIRGVSSDYSIQKLLEKELIIISGRNEDMPGKPLVYSTSKTFMDYFGINSAADLPKLKEVFAETLIEPTVITHGTSEILPETGENSSDGPGDFTEQPAAVAGTDEATLLIVSEDGKLIEHEETEEAADSSFDQSEEQAEEASQADESTADTESDEQTTEEPSEDIEEEESSTESEEPAAEETAEEYPSSEEHADDTQNDDTHRHDKYPEDHQSDKDPADDEHSGHK
ncbi:MAG TPA: SMC-Scp complex subunit ScpB [Puia sp.]|nr:SMC-Scp complex subunit ScpB [Puia sp.]